MKLYDIEISFFQIFSRGNDDKTLKLKILTLISFIFVEVRRGGGGGIGGLDVPPSRTIQTIPQEKVDNNIGHAIQQVQRS